MFTDSKMNTSNSSSQLSLVHPDDIQHPTTPISNMPFDESMELRNSDYISSEAIEISDENNDSDSVNTLEDLSRVEREIDNAYDRALQNKIVREHPEIFNLLPPVPPNEEEKDDEEGILDEAEQKTYNGIYYDDAMDMEAAMREDEKWRKFREENSNNLKFNGINLGDGKMDYIQDKHNKLMMTNAWKAITFSNNWDFVAQDTDSFMWSDDPRINEISKQMVKFGYDGHSGCSFGCTMRNMQFLVRNGEEEFKKLFVEKDRSRSPSPPDSPPPLRRTDSNIGPKVGTTGTFGRMKITYCGGF